MARHDRTVRLETVKRALAGSRRGVALKALAERHGWPLRTLYRDVEALELAGYNIQWEEGRVRLEDSPPPVAGAPTADERLALYLAREAARPWKHTSLGLALDRLWNRVSAAGSSQAALFPVDSSPWITTREWAGIDYGRHRLNLASLERAARERRTVQTRYRALSTGQVTSRVIEPGQLHFDPALETLYLIGWCRLRAAVRIFAVHRFIAVSVLDEPCKPRPETRSATVLRSAFRVWRSDHVHDVKIWFAQEVAEEIRERRWLPKQKVEHRPGGAIILSGEVAGLAEVERWVLGYGPAARVLAPAAFVQGVRRRLAEAADRYDATTAESLSSAGKRGA